MHPTLLFPTGAVVRSLGRTLAIAPPSRRALGAAKKISRAAPASLPPACWAGEARRRGDRRMAGCKAVSLCPPLPSTRPPLTSIRLHGCYAVVHWRAQVPPPSPLAHSHFPSGGGRSAPVFEGGGTQAWRDVARLELTWPTAPLPAPPSPPLFPPPPSAILATVMTLPAPSTVSICAPTAHGSPPSRAVYRELPSLLWGWT